MCCKGSLFLLRERYCCSSSCCCCWWGFHWWCRRCQHQVDADARIETISFSSPLPSPLSACIHHICVDRAVGSISALARSFYFMVCWWGVKGKMDNAESILDISILYKYNCSYDSQRSKMRNFDAKMPGTSASDFSAVMLFRWVVALPLEQRCAQPSRDMVEIWIDLIKVCLLYTSPSPRDS